jgi:ethanolamine utilization protein EutN
MVSLGTRCGCDRGALVDGVPSRALPSLAMYLGIVKGTVVAARKAAGLEGMKLLLVQPVDEHGAAVGEIQAAVDTVQAGDGDLVYLVGSREAALACTPWFVPVDAAIVGIVDGIDVARPAQREPRGESAQREPQGASASSAARGKP